MTERTISFKEYPQRKRIVVGLVVSSIISLFILLGCWPIFDLLLRSLGEQAFSIRMYLFHSREWLFVADFIFLSWVGWDLYQSGITTGRKIRILFWSDVVILLVGIFFSELMLPLMRFFGG